MGIIYYEVKLINFVENCRNYGLAAALYSDFIAMWAFIHLFVALIVIICTAVLTLDERRILADIQLRRGPTKVGYLGFLQQFADAFKLLLKEFVTARQLEDYMFFYASIISFILSTFLWVFLPFTLDGGFDSTRLNILFIFLTTILHSYTIMSAGWASKSKYAFLGGIRSSSQLIAYDVPNSLIYVCISTWVKELDLLKIIEFQVEHGSNFRNFVIQFVVFMICNLAESSRHPFDLTEAEAELVSGFNVEYSSIRFALFFLAEYSSVIFLSIFTVNLFFSGFVTYYYKIEWTLKVFIIVFIIIYLRGLIPRYRFDQLMRLGWGSLVPLEATFMALGININAFFN